MFRIRSWWRGVSAGGMAAAALATALPAHAQRATLRPSTAFGGVQVIHETWNVSDGLPVNAINHLIQSRDGYLWAATFDGLVRFDGVKFAVFNSANSPGLPSNRIIRLEEGARGDLWLATEQGHLVRLRAGRFRVMLGPGCIGPKYFPLAHHADGTTWAGTCDGLVQLSDDRAVPVLPDRLRDRVESLLLRRDGTLLVGDGRRGLVRLRRGADGALQPVTTLADSVLRDARISAMHEAPDGTLWLGTNRGLYTGREGWGHVPVVGGPELLQIERIVAHPRRDGVVVYGLRPWRNAGTVATADGERMLAVDSGPAVPNAIPPMWTSDSTIWFGSGSTVHRNGVPQLRLTDGADGLDGISGGTFEITAGLTDREGSLWLGTFAGGLHRLKPTLVRTISEAEGLRRRNVYGTYVDRTGAVWVGALWGGFSRVAPGTGRVEAFGTVAGLPDAARTFLETRDGTLWVGSSTAIHACSRAPTVTCAVEPAFGGEMFGASALYEDPDGRLWVGTQSGLYRREQGRLVKLDAASGAPSATVRAFAVSRDGALWMATDGGGVVRYREGAYTPVTTADGLPSDLVRALYVDADGWLWIGTEGRGLARLDPRAWVTREAAAGREIAVITTRHGLFDDGIHEVLEDDFGRLWMSSNRGLFWVTREEAMAVADGRAARVRSTGYTERDGMRNREANGGVQPSGAKGLDGRLWFPTQDGVVVVDPRDIVSDTVAPPLVIEQVVAGDSALLAGEAGVRLSPDQRDIRVDFTALTFLEPRNVYFRYRLDGYSGDWVESDTRRSAFFTKLPPGRYTFRVQASDARRGWHEPGASLVIEVVPRFHETPAFRVAVLAALLGLGVATLTRRTRAARRRARELERLVAERTLALRDREQRLEAQNRQLETQAEALQQLDHARSRFFANVSHELRTPLTLMLAPLDRLRVHGRVDAQHERWVDLASRNARRLLDLVNQILDVARLEAGAMHLSPSRFDLARLLRGALESFRMAAEAKQLQLRADVPTTCVLTLDADAIEKIVTNLLSNAVKFTPPSGQITLRLQRGTDAIMITVSNTGPAISPDRLALVFERFYQVDESRTTIQPGTGIGLSLVKELVELQGGTVRATSDETITTFAVELPLDLADHSAPDAITDTESTPTTPISTPTTASEAQLPDVPALLVVDDSEDMRTFIRDHFADRFRVLEAADGLEALALARTQLPDVIISDVMMPRLDGRALVRALREDAETDYLAVILLTAQAESEQRIAGLEGGADDYLGKPFEMRELDARVHNLIAGRRRLQSRFRATAATEAVASDVPHTESAAALPVSPGEPTLNAEDRAYRDKVLSVIRARLDDEDFGVAELADAMAQDRSHLFRRVRQVTGLSPSDLLRRSRVEEGARLLRSGSGSVADVAFSVGFRSVSHFFRCFHEHYKVTPAAYRSDAAAARVP